MGKWGVSSCVEFAILPLDPESYPRLSTAHVLTFDPILTRSEDETRFRHSSTFTAFSNRSRL